jgi:PAS domain S-box-containing protein
MRDGQVVNACTFEDHAQQNHIMKIISSQIQKEDLFQLILNSVGDGVTVIDQDLKIQYQNKMVSQVYGPRIGEHCFTAYRNRETPCENCVVVEVLKDGEERRGIIDVQTPDGDILLVEINSAAIKDENGNIAGAIEVARDVTEQKKAEVLLNRTLLERNAVLKELKNEISNATGYIKTVLPEPLTTGPIHTDWRFIPSAALGGDSFGYHWIDDDHFAIYLLDVSGHGWGAALFSVSVINVLRSHALPHTNFYDPRQVLFALNNAFPAEQHNDMFFTIWYGVYNTSSEELLYSSGGHPPALLFSADILTEGKMVQLRTPDFIVGGSPGVRYQRKWQKIRCPASLFIFSDGVYDVIKFDGSIWGFNEFLEFMEQAASDNQLSLDRVVDYSKELRQKQTFDDDFTIIRVDFK